MNKTHLLNNLKNKELKDNSLPLRENANSLVFGEGNPNADILFLGEAPGRFEDLKGLPFIGPAGKLLDKLLEKINLKREDVFITSVLHYRPPKNRDPKPQELEAFKPYIDKLIKIVDPKIIVTLGRFSLNKFLPNTKISLVHGQARKVNLNRKNVTVIPMYHPAAALRINKLKAVLEEDFKQITKHLNKKRSPK